MAIIDSHPTTIAIGGTLIEHVTSISIDPGTRERRQRTALSDTVSHKYGQGLRSEGTCTFDMMLDSADAGQRLLFQAHAATTPTEQTFTVTYSDGTAPTFNGLVSGLTQNLEIDSDANATVTIIITGPVTGWPAPT